MRVYLDSSIMLAFLLEGRQELCALPPQADVASSRLLWIEVSRVIDRAVRSGQLPEDDGARVRVAFDAMAQAITRLALSEAVLDRAAGAFPVTVRTLDALHLASAWEWANPGDRSDIELWSFDRQMNTCGVSLGFRAPFLEA